MWHASSINETMRHVAPGYGFTVNEDAVGFSWETLKARRDAYITRLNGMYGNMLAGSGVDVYGGVGSFLDANTVSVDNDVHLKVTPSSHFLSLDHGWRRSQPSVT